MGSNKKSFCSRLGKVAQHAISSIFRRRSKPYESSTLGSQVVAPPEEVEGSKTAMGTNTLQCQPEPLVNQTASMDQEPPELFEDVPQSVVDPAPHIMSPDVAGHGAVISGPGQDQSKDLVLLHPISLAAAAEYEEELACLQLIFHNKEAYRELLGQKGTLAQSLLDLLQLEEISKLEEQANQQEDSQKLDLHQSHHFEVATGADSATALPDMVSDIPTIVQAPLPSTNLQGSLLQDSDIIERATSSHLPLKPWSDSVSNDTPQEYSAHQANCVIDATGQNDPVANALKKAYKCYFSQPANSRPKLNLRFFAALDDDLTDEQVEEVQQRFTSANIGNLAVTNTLKKALECYFSQPANSRPKLNIRFFASLSDNLTDEQVEEVQQHFASINMGDPVVANALKKALEHYFSKPANSRPKLNLRFFATLDDNLTDEQVEEVQKRFQNVFPL
ncbi:hypothetical protein Moror_16680 [Moniliophthora roreri MCA 2997]|uniref:Uncharacterized protein n=1 Tax=Moniliophthora roreri (strain MCA 2997) TaxID=1381753 RepID=V2X0A2_MONRO|nr:hypothetical protein Moror_16680 [Moniliophthora roreri MCA 2997]